MWGIFNKYKYKKLLKMIDLPFCEVFYDKPNNNWQVFFLIIRRQENRVFIFRHLGRVKGHKGGIIYNYSNIYKNSLGITDFFKIVIVFILVQNY